MSNRYIHFGLKIKSDIEIPELKEYDFDSYDVKIEYGGEEAISFSDKARKYGNTLYEEDKREIRSYVEGFGGFVVENEDKILIYPSEGSEQRGFRFFIIGTATALLLYQRGFLTLHASAIIIDQAVVAFVGQSGAGKSTTAAIFHSKGYPVLTDDILAVDAGSDRITCLPGFSSLKLNSKSIEVLGTKRQSKMTDIYPNEDKLLYGIESEIQELKLPIESIYFLKYSNKTISKDTPYVNRISGKKSFMEIISHLYSLRLLGKESSTSENIEKVSTLQKNSLTCELYRKNSIENAERIVPLIEKHHGLN